MKEYIIPIAGGIAAFFIFNVLIKGRRPRFKMFSSIIAGIIFIGLFVKEFLSGKTTNDKMVSFLLLAALISYFIYELIKSRKELSGK